MNGTILNAISAVAPLLKRKVAAVAKCAFCGVVREIEIHDSASLADPARDLILSGWASMSIDGKGGLACNECSKHPAMTRNAMWVGG